MIARRRMRSMKKGLFLAVVGLIVALAIAIPVVAGADGGAETAELYAGRNADVGDVNVSYDSVSGNLTVEFVVTSENWTLAEAHVHVGKTIEDIPQTKKGNPIPGKFEYSAEYAPADRITSDSFVIALGPIDEGDTVYVAAHAEVVELDSQDEIVQDESAWGDGEGFKGANWATCIVFVYEVE
jgi:hypothetical protein